MAWGRRAGNCAIARTVLRACRKGRPRSRTVRFIEPRRVMRKRARPVIGSRCAGSERGEARPDAQRSILWPGERRGHGRPCELALGRFRGSAWAGRDMGICRFDGRKGSRRQLGNHKISDLRAAFDRQLPLCDKLADQAVVARVTRRPSRVVRTVRLGGKPRLVGRARELVEAWAA